MRMKTFQRYSLFLTLLLVCTIVLTTSSLGQQQYVTITDFRYQLSKTDQIGNLEARYFTFWVTFSNTGDAPSNNITAYLEDPDPTMGLLEIGRFALASTENITITYQNWPTTLTGDLPINISYDPTKPEVESTQYNSGKKSYKISSGNKNSSDTPGFEIGLLLLAIGIIFFIQRKRKV